MMRIVEDEGEESGAEPADSRQQTQQTVDSRHQIEQARGELRTTQAEAVIEFQDLKFKPGGEYWGAMLYKACCLLSAVCCLLSEVCCLLSAVCCLLSAV
jgi:hypothetical protein